MAQSKEDPSLNAFEVLCVSASSTFVSTTIYAPFLNYATNTLFYWGYIPLAARYIPNLALNFTFKESVREWMFGKMDNKEGPSIIFAKSFLAGGEAGFLTNCLMYSSDNARFRLKGDERAASLGATRQYKNVQDAWRKAMASEGVKGLYKGFIASSVGIYIYRGLFFGLYDSLKPVVFGEDEIFAGNLGLGYITSIIADLTSRPFHTVYTVPLMSLRSEEPYKGALDCMQRLIKMEGYQALFKGGEACVVRGVFGALCLALYDRGRHHYTDYKAGRPVRFFSWW